MNVAGLAPASVSFRGSLTGHHPGRVPPAPVTGANDVSIDPSGDRLSCRGLYVRFAHDHPLDTVERKATFVMAPIAAALGLGVNAIGKLAPSM